MNYVSGCKFKGFGTRRCEQIHPSNSLTTNLRREGVAGFLADVETGHQSSTFSFTISIRVSLTLITSNS